MQKNNEKYRVRVTEDTLRRSNIHVIVAAEEEK